MFRVEHQGSYVILTPNEEISAKNAPQAKEQVLGLVDEGQHLLLVDLEHTEFLDSSALGVLVAAVKAARQVGGSVRLCGLSPNLRQIFELTRLVRLFEIFPDRQAGLADI
jgi:anti-sigma B factor antagonist